MKKINLYYLFNLFCEFSTAKGKIKTEKFKHKKTYFLHFPPLTQLNAGWKTWKTVVLSLYHLQIYPLYHWIIFQLDVVIFPLLFPSTKIKTKSCKNGFFLQKHCENCLRTVRLMPIYVLNLML